MKAFNPIKLLLISIFIWFFFYVQMPVEYLYSGSPIFPIFTLLLFISFFFIGLYSLRTKSIKSINPPSDRKIRQIVFMIFVLGAIGVLLKIYTGLFNSGIFVAEDVFEKRLENMSKELTGGFIGIIGAILFPFAYISLLMVIYNFKIFNKLHLIIIIVFGLYPFIETIFMGGRTIIALLGTTLLFVIYASYTKNVNVKMIKLKFAGLSLFNIPRVLFKKKVFIPLTIIAIVFTSYSVQVVNKRLTRFGYGNRTFKVWEQKDYQWVKFDDEFKNAYFNSSKDDKAKMIGIYSLKHYFAHGPLEYIRLVNQLDSTTGYYYGQYEFNVFFKFFRAFGIPLKSFEQMQSVVQRKNVYQTFFGPFYLDFGVFGFIIMFFWGRFVKRTYIRASLGHTQYVVFYGYLATIIITSIFVNFLVGSSSYYLFAFLVCLLIFRFWPNNLVFVIKK